MSAINAFSVWGIRVRIDQSWFIAFLLFAWTLSAGYFPLQAPDYSPYTYWFFGTLSSLALFGCVLIHELSHSVVAQRLGIPVRQITLFIFGGVSEMEQTHANSPGAEFRITIAGPLASIALGVLFASLAFVLRDRVDRIVGETLHYLYYVNFLLAAFNLIPGFPLDGGRVLRSYLWYKSGDLRQATRSASRVGQVFAMVLIGFGLLSLLSFHIVPGVWLILIGLFLRKSAETEYQSFELRVGLQDMKLREIMTPPIAVSPNMSLSEFVNDYVFHYHFRVFPVVDRNRFLGMVDVRSIKGIPPSDWPSIRVGEHLSDPSTYCVLDPETEATEALRLLISQNCSKAPIVRSGVLLGMLTRGDLFKLISLKSDLAA